MGEAMQDRTEALVEAVREAAAVGQPLRITGGGSKAWYGRAVADEAVPLAVAGHAGIVQYAPSELVVTVRAGTSLAELEAALAEAGQRLPFEPPRTGPAATVGGAVAAGLSGPARPWRGALRDALLGVRLINGQGEPLRFGGQVMKNVAGYDVSRLMAGALGTLSVLLEVSLKVEPRPPAEETRRFELDAATALARLAEWQRQPLPLTGALHDGEALYLRLAGGEGGLQAARERLGGEACPPAEAPWEALRDLRHPFLDVTADMDAPPLWRLSLPPAAPPTGLPGREWIDWGGAQRWLRSPAPAADIRARAEALGGHATLFGPHDGHGAVFHPLPAPLLALHRRVKAALDPQGLFNPGRLYPDL